MNFYIVVEGPCDKRVYKDWISYVNPNISYVDYLTDLKENNYFIVSGRGFPQYEETIVDGIETVNLSDKIDRFVIGIDAGEMSHVEKYLEIQSVINAHPCKAEVFIIVQFFCLETWALGNKEIIRKKIQSQELIRLVNHYDVRIFDPASIPAWPEKYRTREKLAKRYLQLAINDLVPSKSYHESNPLFICTENYFRQIRNRFMENQIQSFGKFIEAFMFNNNGNSK